MKSRSNGRFTKYQLREIRNKITLDVNLEIIAHEYNCSIKLIYNTYGDLIEQLEFVKNTKPMTILGHKNGTFTEEELLEFPNYTWETLSITEKQFYKYYGRKFRTARRNFDD